MNHHWVVRPEGCACGDAVEVDNSGNVLSFRTCSICMKVILAIIRGVEYAVAYKMCGDTLKRVLVEQKEFFSSQSDHCA